MTLLPRQRTLRRAVHLAGFGYLSGRDVQLRFLPATADSGVVFVRSDLPDAPRVAATAQNRVDTPRRTSLECGRARVEMVEHILAALVALGIDNCEIHADQPEMPGFDGSSLAVVQAFQEAGWNDLPAARRRLVIREPLRLGDEQSWVEASPNPAGGLRIAYHLDFGPGPIGKQSLEMDLDTATFIREIAGARTFLLAEEAEWMRRQGLGLRVTTQDLLVFGPQGPLDNRLRYPDECVRHKTLDLIGDLGLAGCDIEGTIVAYRSGHRLNGELVQGLLAAAAGQGAGLRQIA